MRNALTHPKTNANADTFGPRLPGPAMARKLGISRTTLWRMRSLPGFPPPADVTSKLKLYDVAKVERWLESLTHAAAA